MRLTGALLLLIAVQLSGCDSDLVSARPHGDAADQSTTEVSAHEPTSDLADTHEELVSLPASTEAESVLAPARCIRIGLTRDAIVRVPSRMITFPGELPELNSPEPESPHEVVTLRELAERLSSIRRRYERYSAREGLDAHEPSSALRGTYPLKTVLYADRDARWKHALAILTVLDELRFRRYFLAVEEGDNRQARLTEYLVPESTRTRQLALDVSRPADREALQSVLSHRIGQELTFSVVRLEVGAAQSSAQPSTVVRYADDQVATVKKESGRLAEYLLSQSKSSKRPQLIAIEPTASACMGDLARVFDVALKVGGDIAWIGSVELTETLRDCSPLPVFQEGR